MSTEGKVGDKNFKISSIQELCIIIFGVLIGYQIFTFKDIISENNGMVLNKIEKMETTLAENSNFMKNEIGNIKADVGVLKNKVVELESQQRFNNKQVANGTKKDDDLDGDNYYIEHAVFSGEKLVKGKDKGEIKKY